MRRRPAGFFPLPLAAGLLLAGLLTGCRPAATDPVARPVLDLTVPAPDASRPTIAADPRSGAVYAAYARQSGGETNVYLSRLDAGADTLAPPVRVNDRPGDAAAHPQAPPQVTTGPEGTVYVAWITQSPVEGRRFPASDVRLARSTDGGRTFEPPVVVARGTCQCCRTALTVDGGGTVYVVWRHIFGDHIRDIALARSVDGGQTFTEPVRVHTDAWRIEGCPHAGPGVAVDEEGRVHVVWYTGAEGKAGVYYAASADGGATFGPAITLAREAPMAQVGAAPGGTQGGAWIAWEHPAKDSLYVLRATGPDLAPAQALHFSGTLPAVAAAEGIVALAWQDSGKIRLRVLRP